MTRALKLATAAVVIVALSASAALAASSPTVTTGGASLIGQSTATLGGKINPNGAATTYHFEYGLTTAYGQTTSPGSLAVGIKTISVTAPVSGLLPGTRYHYRLDATNAFGTVFGSDRSFRTTGSPFPGASTGPVVALGPFSATVSGVISPQGAATTWFVQYGLTSQYSVQTFGATVPAGHAPVTVSQALTGLEPGTTFHYRFVALHSGSAPQYGNDAVFQTQPWPAPKPRVIASTTPRRARRAPFRFSTFGRIIFPSSDSQSTVCFENVVVAFYRGRRLISSSLVPVEPNCTFFALTTLNSLQAVGRTGVGRTGRVVKLHVVIHFRGNGWLAPANARLETLTIL
jgi:hypothetical protein